MESSFYKLILCDDSSWHYKIKSESQTVFSHRKFTRNLLRSVKITKWEARFAAKYFLCRDGGILFPPPTPPPKNIY